MVGEAPAHTRNSAASPPNSFVRIRMGGIKCVSNQWRGGGWGPLGRTATGTGAAGASSSAACMAATSAESGTVVASPGRVKPRISPPAVRGRPAVGAGAASAGAGAAADGAGAGGAGGLNSAEPHTSAGTLTQWSASPSVWGGGGGLVVCHHPQNLLFSFSSLQALNTLTLLSVRTGTARFAGCRTHGA